MSRPASRTIRLKGFVGLAIGIALTAIGVGVMALCLAVILVAAALGAVALGVDAVGRGLRRGKLPNIRRRIGLTRNAWGWMIGWDRTRRQKRFADGGYVRRGEMDPSMFSVPSRIVRGGWVPKPGKVLGSPPTGGSGAMKPPPTVMVLEHRIKPA